MSREAEHIAGGNGLRVAPGEPVTFVRWTKTRDHGWKLETIHGTYQNNSLKMWRYRDSRGKTHEIPRPEWNLSIP